MTEIVNSKNAVPIRLTDKKWAHITEEHSELTVLRQEVLETVANPTAIFAWNLGESLAVRELKAGKYLAVYRESQQDGFIITAFLTWKRQTLLSNSGPDGASVALHRGVLLVNLSSSHA